ncbi:hypothetical protein J9T75_000243 [Salmonella enterica]|nr:hypothetical protein [Salmonella enterica]
MTKTLNPTITVTVSGPTGSGKSRVLAVIADVLKLIHSDCIIEAPDVKAEKEMCGDDHTAWHKPRSGTIFKLEEVNLPDNHQNKPAGEITVDDLIDRPVPVHIQGLMSMLGISFEEFKETDLQPVVDLVNWALTTPPVPEQKIQTDKKGNEDSSRNPNCLSGVTNKDKKNAPQVTLLAQEDIIHKVVESVIALLDYRKQQQIYHEELAEKIRKELLNLHNRPG